MKIKKILLTCALIIFSGVFVFSGYKVISSLYQYNEAEKFYEDLSVRFVTTYTPPVSDGNEVDAPTGTENGTVSEVTPSSPAEHAPITVDFDALRDYCGDVVGWLYCEDTVMNYPVAKSSDNSYYLRRSLEGKYLITGTIFADYRCTSPATDKSYVIYGHDMKNGTIFGMLKNYADPAYMKSHPSYYYLMPDGDYKIDVYAGVTVNSTDKLYDVRFEESELIPYVKALTKGGTVTDSFDLEDDDRIMILSTCSDEFEGARFVLIGKITPLS